MRAVTITVRDIIHDLSEILYDITSDRSNLNMDSEVKIFRGSFFAFERDNDGSFILTIPSITTDDLKD